MTFETKFGDNKNTFLTGAQRDESTGKTRYDLIPLEVLDWLADLYASVLGESVRLDLIPVEGFIRTGGLYGRGAGHYGERNWEKGIPYSRMYESLLRHVFAWRRNDPKDTEDHAAAIAWFAMGVMYYDAQIAAGTLPAELDDRHLIGRKTNGSHSE